uniref:Uncharacterized protein n=1 Tax=Anguilla anguilla TaxID=7936 RepID=A0A0E9S887_ANGAN
MNLYSCVARPSERGRERAQNVCGYYYFFPQKIFQAK